MKKIIFSIVLLSGSTFLFAQRDQRNVPQSVQQSWQRDHANEGKPTWQQSNGQWHANYKDNTTNRNVDTYYDGKGREVDTHREMDRKDLPQTYDQRINQRYHANGNYNVVKINRPNQKEIFQVKVQNAGKNRVVYTDRQGREVKYRDQHR